MEPLVKRPRSVTLVNVRLAMLACDVINVSSSICAQPTPALTVELVKHKAERQINTPSIVCVESNTPAHVVKHESPITITSTTTGIFQLQLNITTLRHRVNVKTMVFVVKMARANVHQALMATDVSSYKATTTTTTTFNQALQPQPIHVQLAFVFKAHAP